MGSNQKIKVIHLASGDLWAGAEAQVFTIVKELHADASIDVTAIILNDGELSERLKKIGVETKIIDESKYSFFEIRKQCYEYLKTNQCDILHTHRFKENIIGAYLKKKKVASKLVQTVHGAGEPFRGLAGLRARFTSTLNRYYTKKEFDKIIAVSDDMIRILSQFAEPDRIKRVYNAIDINNIVIKKSSSEVRSELKVAEDDILIGSAGRLVPVKAYDLFIRSAKIALDKNKKLKFLLVGDGPLHESLKAQVNDAGISEYFIMPGFRSDIHDILNALDIFVMSSNHEGVPVVLLEAMFLAKPTIVTAVGGMVEIVENEISGVYVKPRDEIMMADNILQLTDDYTKRKTIGANAKIRIENKFTSEIQKNELLSLYQNFK